MSKKKYKTVRIEGTPEEVDVEFTLDFTEKEFEQFKGLDSNQRDEYINLNADFSLGETSVMEHGYDFYIDGEMLDTDEKTDLLDN